MSRPGLNHTGPAIRMAPRPRRCEYYQSESQNVRAKGTVGLAHLAPWPHRPHVLVTRSQAFAPSRSTTIQRHVKMLAQNGRRGEESTDRIKMKGEGRRALSKEREAHGEDPPDCATCSLGGRTPLHKAPKSPAFCGSVWGLFRVLLEPVSDVCAC